MANIFKQQKDVNNNPKRNNFDLSFQNHLTMKMGTLYPVFCKEVVPGDSFRIQSAFGLKFMPLAFPVQSKMRASMQFFYVRNKNLWKDWENWVSGLKGHADGVDHPYISQDAEFFKTGKLADYLNVPTTLATSGNISIGIPALFDQYVYTSEFQQDEGGDILRTLYTNTINTDWFAAHNHDAGDTNGLECNAIQFMSDAFSLGEKFSAHFSSLYDSYFCVAWQPTSHLLGDTGVSFRFHGTTFENASVKVALVVRKAGVSDMSKWWIARVENDTLSSSSEEVSFTLSNGFVSAWNNHVSGGLECALAVMFTTSDFAGSFGKDSNYDTTFYFGKTLSMTVSSSTIEEYDYASPFTSSANAIRLNALPFRAYESIVRCYYKNPTIQPLLIGGTPEYNRYNTTIDGGADTTPYKLERRNYELDFLTSALPSPQQGNAPLVGFNAITGTITIEDESGITTAKADIDSNGTIVGLQVTSPIAGKEHAITAAQLATCGMSINSFRDTNALQRWLETNIRKGYRYFDFIAGHFGKSPAYRELDMPEFIGGYSRDVTVSQVVSTADTLNGDSGANLGTFGGTANCFGGSNHSVSHYCDDFGFIIGILCVTPTPSYSQLLPKHYLKYNPLDYYFPEFAQLGMQPITYEEVCPIQRYTESLPVGSNKSVTDTFGYQRPNYDLVASVDEIHGQFRGNLHNFLINRVFESSPVLGDDFLQIDPDETNQIFVDTAPDNDNIIGQVIFDCKAKRPVPRVVIPSLGR